MTKTIKLLLLSSLFTMTHAQLKAVPADPQPKIEILPNGASLTIKTVGDEFFHYLSTLDGYPVVKTENGYYQYATYNNNGNWVNTGVNASDCIQRGSTEKTFLKTLPSPQTTLLRKSVALRTRRMAVRNDTKTSSFPTTGSPRSLVILVNFQNKNFIIPNASTAFSTMLNQDGYSENEATGSAKDYFRSASMGKFTPQFDVYGPYTLPEKMSFYGNDSGSSNNINAKQMVIDACGLADKDVNFADYDLDGNGIVDGVFIYYAGYNQAEGGPDYTVWPHRNKLKDYNTKFDNVSVYDYACTSELKGSSGGIMCGIGPFCHEFGHVLGLQDLYNTQDGDAYTIGRWDVMDQGVYNNSKRTPPTYSAYERFYMGWLTPEVLSTNNPYSLDALDISNKAYLISPSDYHNLNGKAPDPAEFFLIENRQQAGWDKYLPGHGLLVTHIVYNADDWRDPNNVPSAMGIDIIEADGIASSSTADGDAFPYASTNYLQPQLRNGDFTNIRIEDIQETDGKISFNVKTNTTSTNDIQNDIRISTHGNTTTVTVPENETDLYIYNIMGQLIQTIHSASGVFELNNLPHQQVILLKSGKYSEKLIIN